MCMAGKVHTQFSSSPSTKVTRPNPCDWPSWAPSFLPSPTTSSSEMRRVVTIVMILCAAGCIDPINLRVAGVGGTLVVEGVITDQDGPYTVKLSRSIAYEHTSVLKVYNIPEQKANVSIVDETGVVENMVEETAGSYVTTS